MGEMPYPALQSMFDPFFPKGLQWYWRGDFVKELTDEAIDAHIAQARNVPSALSLMHLYPIDGAVRRVGKSDTAWNTRDATWSMVIAGIDPNPQKAGEITRWTKGYWEAVHPYSADGANEGTLRLASLIIISVSHSRWNSAKSISGQMLPLDNDMQRPRFLKVGQVRFGSKPEKLNASTCFPLCPSSK
jgi:hypothetical protein